MVTVEGVFQSGSTTVLLTLPISVLGCLPQDPALSFVAFVDSLNMLLHLPRSRRTREKRSDDSEETLYSPSNAGFSGWK